MPTISIFYGILIQMYFNDHAPPHFHIRYAEYQGVITIENPMLIEGHLPPRALQMALEWAKLHQGELMDNWLLCQNKSKPNQIAPLA